MNIIVFMLFHLSIFLMSPLTTSSTSAPKSQHKASRGDGFVEEPGDSWAGQWNLVGGFNSSEKYEFVSWDDYSQYMENKIHVPNHQPATLDGVKMS